MNDEFFSISCYVHSSGARLFTKIINQGIDSRLEAFVKSKFSVRAERLYLDFHADELSILLRRLGDSDWVDDIVREFYGVEL